MERLLILTLAGQCLWERDATNNKPRQPLLSYQYTKMQLACHKYFARMLLNIFVHNKLLSIKPNGVVDVAAFLRMLNVFCNLQQFEMKEM